MTLRSFFLVFALFLTALVPSIARAADPIGTVVELEGTATDSSNGISRALNINDNIYLNDTITTFKGSKILVLFADDTEITLGEDSNLTIDSYIFDPANKTEPSATFSVMRGAFLLVSGLISKTPDPKVKINTTYGSIGLRGTTVWGGVLDNEYGVLVQDGTVDVTNEGGTTTITKGLGSFMHNRKEKPRPPKAWAQAKTDRAVAAIFLKRQELIKLKIEEKKIQNAALRVKRKEMLEQKLENRLENKPVHAPEQQREQKLKRYLNLKMKKAKAGNN